MSPCKLQAFSPDFLVRKFSVNGQFLQIFGRIARKPAEIVRLRKISSPKNQGEKLVFYVVCCSGAFLRILRISFLQNSFLKKNYQRGNKSLMKVSHTRKSYLCYRNRYAINDGKTLA